MLKVFAYSRLRVYLWQNSKHILIFYSGWNSNLLGETVQSLKKNIRQVKCLIPRTGNLDPDFQIFFDDESASSDSYIDYSNGELRRDKSPLQIHEQSTYVVYSSCLHEFLIYCIKCGNQISSNLTEEFGCTESQLTCCFIWVDGILIFI